MRRVVGVVAAALALALVAAPAQATETPIRMGARVVCVLPDFQVTGSGWKLHAGLDTWNRAQHLFRFTAEREPGCAQVIVHRYDSPKDAHCGYTTWQRTWASGHWDASGAWVVAGADVYLNDGCTFPSKTNRWSRWLIAHELGHTLGLTHTTRVNSIMSEVLLNLRGPLIDRRDVHTLAALYRQ